MAGTVAASLSTRDKMARAKAASAVLAQLSTAEKNALLLRIADALESQSAEILKANQEDLRISGLSGAMYDRLLLTPERISETASAARQVAAVPDPVGEVIAEWTRPNGLVIKRVRVPFGVVGIVYESRPNVTVDAGVLALKTGNAAVLRGGKEAAHSNEALAEIMTHVVG